MKTEYKLVKIKDLDIYISDGNYSSKYPRSEEFVKDGVPFIRANNIVNKTIIAEDMYFITMDKHEKLQKGHLKVNDILITTRGNLGNIAIVTKDYDNANINAQIVLLRVKNEQIIPNYLKWCFETWEVKHQIQQLSTGTALKQLPVSKLSQIKIPLPPIASQRRIADILDKADEIIRKRKEAIALTEQLQKSIFLDIFGDPVTNPKGWEKVTLGNLLAEELQNGAYFEKNYYTNDLTGVEMIHMSDAFYGTVTRGNLKRVLVSDAEVKKYQLNSDDILIARRSLNYEGAAKPCLIEDCCNPLIFESSLIRVRVKKNIINPIYLFSYMMQPRAREKYIYPYVTRSTISGINQAGLKKITIVVPPIALQNRFKEICNQIKKNSLKLELHLQESENLFNSLLQKAFKGEL